jgi:calcineurin-like phosphoesterase family protein
MTIYFTADNHFGHKSILRFCANTRLGQGVADHIDTLHNDKDNHNHKDRHKIHQTYVNMMDEAMIRNWSSTVQGDDTVYVLGDFSFYKADNTDQILERLPGKKILVKGNHDHWLTDHTARHFEEVHQYLEVTIEDKFVVMCHYPFAEYNKMHYGAYHLHGHTHGKFQHKGRAMDVGIDARPQNDMGLWSWEEIDKNLSVREVLTHHDAQVD